MPNLWTPNQVACKVQLKDQEASIILVGHYRQPQRQSELKAELNYLITHINERYNNPNIVIAGDFNISPSRATAEAINYGLRLA